VTGGLLVKEDPALVKIEGIKSCQTCHNSTVGVRSGCIDCHTYHHGDFPLQGRGAPDLGPKAKYSIGDFLKGK
jgi:hypothetical protein